MHGLLLVIAANVVPSRGEIALVARQIVGFGPTFESLLEGAKAVRRRRVGACALAFDRFGVRFQIGRVGSPKTAGARLTIGRLEDARLALRGNQHGAVEQIERKRAGRISAW